MRILLTGAAGFVGCATARALRDEGHDVLGIDVRVSDNGGITEICDLRNIHGLYRVGRNFSPEAIIHCGGVSGPMLFRDDPTSITEPNISGTVNLLEFGRSQGIDRFIFCSSIAVYGRQRNPVAPLSEEVSLHPTSVYAATKVAGEAITNSYGLSFGIPAVSLRIGKVYGPGRETDCEIREMILNAINGKRTELPYGAKTPQHYIFIEDVVRGITTALSARSYSQPSYNVVGAETVTLAEVAKIVEELIPSSIITVGEENPPLDDILPPLSYDAARRDFGFKANVRLKDGIGKYSKWLSEARGASRASRLHG
ncbi:NAD-dependent epimerase/dehydratase family protein [Microvirga sp. M2]|uniref:NAD-dependent epimerase/dehydratase family protein n=1 Tax=Microvirga sp. M2 TaxID=3073270 RepID=UPI0039C3E70F